MEQVVCINKRPIEGCNNTPAALALLSEGMVYTVRERFEDRVHLEEIAAPNDNAYAAVRFRPCKPTSIEVFKQMLEPVDA